VAIQYDLADITAMLAVPAMISFFVWRDGAFALDGTDIRVLPCELGTMWSHFLILLVIKCGRQRSNFGTTQPGPL
jgi:hypothetical protein